MRDMTHIRVTTRRGDGDITGDDAPPRPWFILLAICMVACSIVVAAESLKPRSARSVAAPAQDKFAALKSVAASFDEMPVSVGARGDRLPVASQPPSAAPQEADPVPPAAAASSTPPTSLAQATDDDIRQADAEHKPRRKHDICPKGRDYYMKGRYQYWRCIR
jgi:hypothetical protein